MDEPHGQKLKFAKVVNRRERPENCGCNFEKHRRTKISKTVAEETISRGILELGSLTEYSGRVESEDLQLKVQILHLNRNPKFKIKTANVCSFEELKFGY